MQGARLLAGVERTTLAAEGHRIVLLGACQGLDGEAEATAEAIRELRPATVALALDPDLVDHVHELGPGSEFSVEDAAYRRGLGRWGEVKLPPPEYEAAVSAAEDVDADVTGVDLPEEAYLDRYTARIGVLDLAKRAFRVRWMKTRPPKATTPAEFCRRFDERINQGPFADLEHAREAEIARRLVELSRDGPVACVLEIQRVDGVRAVLQAPPDASP